MIRALSERTRRWISSNTLNRCVSVGPLVNNPDPPAVALHLAAASEPSYALEMTHATPRVLESQSLIEQSNEPLVRRLHLSGPSRHFPHDVRGEHDDPGSIYHRPVPRDDADIAPLQRRGPLDV